MGKRMFTDAFSYYNIFQRYADMVGYTDFIVPTKKDTHTAGTELYGLLMGQKKIEIVSCIDNPGHFSITYNVAGFEKHPYTYNVYSIDSEELRTDNHTDRCTKFLDVSKCLDALSKMYGYCTSDGYIEKLPNDKF